MENFLVFGIIFYILYSFIQFARQERIQEDYDETINDIEGRLEWARTRTFFPFGMKSQLSVSKELLAKAKNLWKNNRWQQAYRVALQSQDAINKAQRLYCSAIRNR